MAIEEQFTLLAIGLVIIGMRVFVRWRQVGPGNWEFDDYLMPLVGVVFTLETVAAHLVGSRFGGLTNSYMTDEERAALDPNSIEHMNRVWGSKIQVIGWSFYAFILWGLKFCVAALYSRLTNGLPHLRLRVIIAYVSLGITYTAVALLILLSCLPMHKFWQISPDPGRMCKPTNSPAYVLGVVIPNILTDIYLLSIPLPLLWGVKIGLRRKISLIALFSGAIFIIMAGTIRAVVILTSGPEGAVSGSTWACRETFVAVTVSNLPTIQPLIRKGANKIGLSMLFSRNTASNGGESHQLRSTDLNGSRFKKSGTSRHPLSVPQATAWASDEHILSEDGNGKSSLHKDNGGIIIASEVRVQSEQLPPPSSSNGEMDPAGSNWGYQASAARKSRI